VLVESGGRNKKRRTPRREDDAGHVEARGRSHANDHERRAVEDGEGHSSNVLSSKYIKNSCHGYPQRTCSVDSKALSHAISRIGIKLLREIARTDHP
jgi:hypothetical protein